MPHHGNEDEHQNEQEPVSFQDKRRIDPDTGNVRDGGTAPSTDQGTEGSPQDAKGAESAGAADQGEDAVSQAEQILRDAADAEGLSEEEAALAGTVSDAEVGAGSAREEELRTDLLRLQAEFVNYKRRVDRDRNVARDTAIQSLLTALLPVLDDLDAARAAGDLTEGPMASIAAKLDQILAGFGLERQDQESLAGQEFNPAQHEAMLRQPSDEVPAEHIVQVFRNGYARGERVLRPAQVMVSAGKG